MYNFMRILINREQPNNYVPMKGELIRDLESRSIAVGDGKTKSDDLEYKCNALDPFYFYSFINKSAGGFFTFSLEYVTTEEAKKSVRERM